MPRALQRGLQPVTDQPASAAVDANKYYAVLLSNGSVYFGKLEGLGPPYPVLREMYYAQTTTNPENGTGERMIVNDKAVVFVEPVGGDSKVSQLIADSRR